MLTRDQRMRTRLNQVVDGGLFACALGLAYWLRAAFASWHLPELERFETYLWLFPLVALAGPLMLASQGFYRRPQLKPRLVVILTILRGCTFTVVGLILLLFLLRQQFARSVILLVGGFGGFFVYARHELVQWVSHPATTRRRVLWVGRRPENERVRAALSGLEREAVDSVGEWDPTEAPAEPLAQRLHRDQVNTAVISLVGLSRNEVETALATCEAEGIEVLVRPGLSRPSPYRLSVEALGGEVVLQVRAQAAPAISLAAKRIFDGAAAALLLVGLGPLLVVVALAVRLTSPGPVLFRQPRAGINGRPFTMLKFRSMRLGAEAEQPALAAENTLRGPVFKHAADPRVTPLGRLLRRHSLDELPQLWNVLRGEMSLVGPRPLPLPEASQLAAGRDRRRLSVRPGMTGLWQISGRSDLADFADWVQLDLAYIDQWTLWLDLKILLATLPVAVLGRGGR